MNSPENRHRVANSRVAWNYAFLLCAFFAATLALAGGASRADSASQVVVRSASVLVLVIAIASRAPFTRARWLISAAVFVSAMVALIVLQLIPLPADVWAALPGRGFYAQAGIISGQPQAWRPVSLTPDLTLNALLGLLPSLTVLVLAAAAKEEEVGWSLSLFVVAALASAMLGLAQLAGGPESGLRFYRITSIGSPTGFFANRNHQAALLASAIPAIALWAISPSRYFKSIRLRSSICIAATALLLLSLIANGSRAGVLLTILGVVAAAPWWWQAVRSLRPPRRVSWLIGAGTAALIGAIVVTAFLFNRSQSLGRLFAKSSDLDMRARWLEPGEAMLKSFFPFGSGIGSFDSVFRRFEPFDLLRWTYANELHNDLVQTVIEAGICGAALLCVYGVWWLHQVARIVRSPVTSQRRLATVGAVITGMLMLASAVDYPLRTPTLAVVFTLASVWMLRIGCEASEVSPTRD